MTAALKRDKPLYISDHCECGTQLMLFDSWTDPPNTDESKIWYDEWICPSCIKTNPDDGIRLDWTKEHKEEVFAIAPKSSKFRIK